jgi:short-subunit dehydrogenase
MTNTALITGASSGLGAEFATILAEQKWNLILVARNADALHVLGKKLETTHGINVQTISLDLALHDASALLIKEIGQTQITLLINNAGFGDFGFFQDMDPARTRQMIDLNIGTLTDLTRSLLPRMVTAKQGRILNIGSIAAFQPGPLMTVYYATKAYVVSFSEALSNELQDTGISVTCLCPGPTKTAFAQNAHMATANIFKYGAMDAHTVAAQGIQACMRGKRLVIPGWRNRLGTIVVRFLPIAVTAQVARMVHSRHTNTVPALQ